MLFFKSRVTAYGPLVSRAQEQEAPLLKVHPFLLCAMAVYGFRTKKKIAIFREPYAARSIRFMVTAPFFEASVVMGLCKSN